MTQDALRTLSATNFLLQCFADYTRSRTTRASLLAEKTDNVVLHSEASEYHDDNNKMGIILSNLP